MCPYETLVYSSDRHLVEKAGQGPPHADYLGVKPA